MRSFWRLSHENAGFVADGVLSFQVNLSSPRYQEDGAPGRFYAQALERIAALPGVESAGGISWRPLGLGSATSFEVPDHPKPPPGHEPVADVRMVTPGLFRTLGIALTQGRDFETRDDADRPMVVVVNETLAREFWPGQSPLGRRIRMEWGPTHDAEIVGVVGEVRLTALDEAPRKQIYWAVAQLPNYFFTFLVKTPGRPASLAGPVKEAVASVDPTLPVARIEALSDAVGDSLKQPRFTFVLLGAFALTAALLAALGLFGVLSYSVTERLREMGIRLALGARPHDVARLVLWEGTRLAMIGTAVGLAGALLISGLLSRFLYETSPRDPLAFLSVAAFVAVLAVLAAAVPARRASRVHPSTALRAE
jgi:putative ABC transport system permease protein